MIVLYSADPSPDLVLNALQQSFLSVQQGFSTLNLVLNTSKTKIMWFGKKNFPLPTDVITTSEGLELEVVTSYKYLVVWLDSALSFSQHISKLQAKVKSRFGFFYRNRFSFTPAAKLALIQMTSLPMIQMTILPMLDYGDITYRSAGKGALELLNILYNLVIRFATNAPYRTHHYTPLLTGNLCIPVARPNDLCLFIKTLLGFTPPNLRYLLQPSSSTYNTCSASHILLKVPKAHTSLDHSSFQFPLACNWNELQQTLKLDSFFSISSFKDLIQMMFVLSYIYIVFIYFL